MVRILRRDRADPCCAVRGGGAEVAERPEARVLDVVGARLQGVAEEAESVVAAVWIEVHDPGVPAQYDTVVSINTVDLLR